MLSSPSFINSDITTLPVNENNIRDVEYIKELLTNHNGNANIKCSDGTPLIAFAIHCEALETTKFLLEQKADVKATDVNNRNSIHMLIRTSPEFFAACFDWALEREHWQIVAVCLLKNIPEATLNQWRNSLMQTNANGQNTLSQIDKLRATLLYPAITKQNLKAVRFLLEHNVSPNVTCCLGSPLIVAIEALEYPANAKFAKKESSTYQANNPVMYEIIELLLQNNANPRSKVVINNDRFTALTFSVHVHDVKLLDLVLAHNPHLLTDANPIEATKRFLLEADESHKTPLMMAIGKKSRKMYDYLLTKCPNLIMEDRNAFSDFFNHAGDYSKFMNEVLSSLPYAKRKLLFQAYSANARHEVVSRAMSKNSVPLATVLLKQGATLPTVTKDGKLTLDKAAQRKLAFPNWKTLFQSYFEDLTAAQSSSAVVLATNVIYDNTHQNEFAVEQLEGYLPTELFDLYKSTPQRRDFQEAHYRPELRECLEEALEEASLLAESTHEGPSKKTRINP